MHIRFPACDTTLSYPDCIIAGVWNGKKTVHKPPFQKKVVSIPKICLWALIGLNLMNHDSQNCVSKRVGLWEILAVRWIRSWFHPAFLLPQTWKIRRCNYSHTILWTSCILCPENPHIRAELWQILMWRSKALLDKSVHKQTKPLTPVALLLCLEYPCCFVFFLTVFFATHQGWHKLAGITGINKYQPAC